MRPTSEILWHSGHYIRPGYSGRSRQEPDIESVLPVTTLTEGARSNINDRMGGRASENLLHHAATWRGNVVGDCAGKCVPDIVGRMDRVPGQDRCRQEERSESKHQQT